ncbi:hypothetical protein Tco_1569678 [Tanacetum coccineum]
MAQMRAAAPSTYHPLLPSGTPPLLPIPLPAPSTSRRADIPEADTPPRKRLLLTAPRPGCEVGESSAAAAARQPGPTMARRVDCSSVDTVETRVRDTERRMMAALEVVNLRVSYQVDVRSRESSEFYSRHHDAQKDRAAVRAEIEVLRRERLAYEQESMETRQALARSEAYSRALEARITVLETQARRHEWQRQDANDRVTRHIMRIQALEAGARDDTLEDTASNGIDPFDLSSYPGMDLLSFVYYVGIATKYYGQRSRTVINVRIGDVSGRVERQDEKQEDTLKQQPSSTTTSQEVECGSKLRAGLVKGSSSWELIHCVQQVQKLSSQWGENPHFAYECEESGITGVIARIKNRNHGNHAVRYQSMWNGICLRSETRSRTLNNIEDEMKS